MKNNSYTIEGRNPVIESIRSKQKPIEVYLEQNIREDGKIKEIIYLANKYKVPVKKVGKKKLNALSATHHHQGVIAVKRPAPQLSLKELLVKLDHENKQPFLIVVRDALYEHNLGAIIRSAECTGVDAVIIPPKVSITPQVVRTSMGATEHVNIVSSSFFQTLKILSKHGIRICAIEVNSPKYYFEEDLTGPVAFIIGGEDHSLTDTIHEKADFSVKIPLKGQVNSLNMSVATGIVLFEKVRQEMV